MSKAPQNNRNTQGIDSYIRRGNEIDVGTTKYVIISIQKDVNNAVMFEWFKNDTPLNMLYNFVPLIDPSILDFELFYKISKTDPLLKIERHDKRTLKDIFSNHIVELQLGVLSRATQEDSTKSKK